MMENITDNVRITGLLKRLLEQRALLTVSIDGQSQQFTSAIFKISANNSVFYLDGFKPGYEHLLLKTNPCINIRAQLDGIRIAFDAGIADIGEQEGLPYYKLNIPKNLEYYQRRASVRVALGAAQPLPVSLKSAEGGVLEGTIADLSLGGLRIRFAKNIPEHIQPGQHFRCRFSLPPDNKQAFSSELVVRGVKRRDNKTKAVFIGGQFTDTAKRDEHQIQRAVMFLQRTLQQRRYL